MERLPQIAEHEQDDAQKQMKGNVAKLYSAFPSTLEYQQEDGKIYGCFHTLLYSPHVIQPWWNLAFAVLTQPVLSVRERELAILATLSVYNGPFHEHAHTQRGPSVGLTSKQLEQGFSGQVPEDLDEVETAIYNTSLVIAKTTGSIPDEEFQKALEHLSREKIVALVHMVCGYFYVSKLAGIGDGELPAAAST